MAEDDWGGRDIEYVMHGLGRYVSEIDDHSYTRWVAAIGLTISTRASRGDHAALKGVPRRFIVVTTSRPNGVKPGISIIDSHLIRSVRVCRTVEAMELIERSNEPTGVPLQQLSAHGVLQLCVSPMYLTPRR